MWFTMINISVQYFTSGSNFNASTVNVSRIGGLAPSYDFCPFHQPHALVSYECSTLCLDCMLYFKSHTLDH